MCWFKWYVCKSKCGRVQWWFPSSGTRLMCCCTAAWTHWLYLQASFWQLNIMEFAFSLCSLGFYTVTLTSEARMLHPLLSPLAKPAWSLSLCCVSLTLSVPSEEATYLLNEIWPCFRSRACLPLSPSSVRTRPHGEDTCALSDGRLEIHSGKH